VKRFSILWERTGKIGTLGGKPQKRKIKKKGEKKKTSRGKNDHLEAVSCQDSGSCYLKNKRLVPKGANLGQNGMGQKNAQSIF